MKPPHSDEHIQSAWRLYNALEDFSRQIWETYDLEFLDHFFHEVTEEHPHTEPLEEGEDPIPF